MVNYEWPGVTENCGGGGRIATDLAAGLRDRGHTVTVITDDRDGHYLTFPFRTYRRVVQTIRSHDIDVIHGQFAVPSSLCLPRIATTHDIPLVVSVMGADVYDPTRYSAVRPFVDAVVARVLSAANAVVAPSRDMQARVDEKYDLDAELVHYGVQPDDCQWKRREPGNTLRVLTVCRLVERKNLEAALGALFHAKHQGLDVTWDIVGTGPLYDRYSDNWNDVEWLTMYGYVDDLQERFDAADVFMLPSHHEAFGIVFLEALEAGLPVVTSDHGGQTDIVTNGVGETAPPDDAEALGDALCTIATNYDEYQAATRHYVSERFSRDEMVTEYTRIYGDVIT